MTTAVDREVRARFRLQAGVVSRAQLRAIGLGRSATVQRVASGEWVPVGRVVLRLDAVPVTEEQRLWVAVLECGPSAVVSHASAAWLWDLAPVPGRHSVTVMRDRRPLPSGAAVHRPVDYPARVVNRRAFPCTDPLRTIVDLAATADPAELLAAVERALSSRLATLDGVEAEAARLARRGRTGIGALHAVLLDAGVAGGPSASVLERRLLRLLAQAGVGPVVTECRVGPDGRYRVDARIGAVVVVEVDGWAYHASPEAKQEDERRRNRLRLDGLFVLVYTWRDVLRDGPRVVGEVRRALATTPTTTTAGPHRGLSPGRARPPARRPGR